MESLISYITQYGKIAIVGVLASTARIEYDKTTGKIDKVSVNQRISAIILAMCVYWLALEILGYYANSNTGIPIINMKLSIELVEPVSVVMAFIAREVLDGAMIVLKNPLKFLKK